MPEQAEEDEVFLEDLERKLDRLMHLQPVQRPQTAPRVPRPPSSGSDTHAGSAPRAPRQAVSPDQVLRRAGGRCAGSAAPAFHFDGAGGFAQLPIISELDRCAESFQIDMWVCAAPGDRHQAEGIVDIQVAQRRYSLQLAHEQLRLRSVDDRGVMSKLVCASEELTDGAWHFLQIQWRPQPSLRMDGRRLKHDMDRAEDGTRPPRGGQVGSLAVIGCALPVRKAHSTLEPFCGAIAEVRLWNCATQPPRVAARYGASEGTGGVRDACGRCDPARLAEGCEWRSGGDCWPATVLRLTGGGYLSAGTLRLGCRLPEVELRMWFATRSTAAASLFGVTDTQKRHQRLLVSVNQDAQQRQEPNTIRMELRDCANRSRVAVLTPDPPPPHAGVNVANGHWHHLVVRVRGGDFSVELDGREAVESELSTSGVGGPPEDFAPLLDFVAIGAHNDRGRPCDFFDGLLSGVSVRVSPDELVADWPLDDGPGAAVLTDHGGTHNHAVFRIASRRRDDDDYDTLSPADLWLSSPPRPAAEGGPVSPSRTNFESAVADKSAQEWVPLDKPPREPLHGGGAGGGEPPLEELPLRAIRGSLLRSTSVSPVVSTGVSPRGRGSLTASRTASPNLLPSDPPSPPHVRSSLRGSASGDPTRALSWASEDGPQRNSLRSSLHAAVASASLHGSFLRRRRRTLESEEITQQVAEALRQLVVLQGMSETVDAALTALSEICDAKRLLPSVAEWLAKRQRTADAGEVAPFRYSEGVAEASDPAEIDSRALSADYGSAQDVWAIVQSTDEWFTPFGPLWHADVVRDMLWDCQFVARTHGGGYPPHVSAPLHCVSSELCHRVVWAVWSPAARQTAEGRWSVLRRWVELEEGWDGEAGTLELSSSCAAATELAQNLAEGGGGTTLGSWQDDKQADVKPAATVSVSGAGSRRRYSLKVPDVSLTTRCSLPCGLSVLHSRSPVMTVVRYENLVRNVADVSPLCEAVGWLPPRDVLHSGPFALAEDGLPPQGVIEYVFSRPASETLSGKGWRSCPIDDSATAGLREACAAEPNQLRHSPELHAALVRLVARGVSGADGVGADVVASLVREKLRGVEQPTPAAVMQAVTMQRLTHAGRTYILAISGVPCAAAVRDTGTSVARLWRVTNVCADQVLKCVDSALRCSQQGLVCPSITVDQAKCRVGGDDAVGGRYVGPDPFQWYNTPGGADVCAFVREKVPKHVAWWVDGDGWKVALEGGAARTVTLEPDGVSFEPASWLLPKAMPLVSLVERAVSRLATSSGRVYRAAPAPLPANRYYKGALVVWSGFSACSRLQGVAADSVAAGNEKPAVLLADCRQCADIAQWSRFGRAADCLLPLGTTWVVERAHSDAQEPLAGRVGTHYEMREVDSLEALEVMARQLVATVPTSPETAPPVRLESKRQLTVDEDSCSLTGGMSCDFKARVADDVEQLLEVASKISSARVCHAADDVPETFRHLTWALGTLVDADRSALYNPESWALARELVRIGADASRLNQALSAAWTGCGGHGAEKLDTVLSLVQCGADHNIVQHMQFGFAYSTETGYSADGTSDGFAGGAERAYFSGDGGSPLHLAVREGRLAYVRPLISIFGLQVDLRDAGRKTALHWAAKLGRLSILKLLLELGADPEAADAEGRTALHFAAAAGAFERSDEGIEMIGDLATRRAVDHKDQNGWTAYHAALSKRHFAVADRLKERGADTSAQVGKFSIESIIPTGGPSAADLSGARALTEYTAARPQNVAVTAVQDATARSWKRRLDSFFGPLPTHVPGHGR